MNTHFDHYFWQLRELQRAIDQLQPQLRTLDSIPCTVGEQIDGLLQAQVALHHQLVEMLKAVWFNDERVSPTNQAVLTFLEDWSREPDDKGEDWWASFEEELEKNRKFKNRDIEQGA